MRATIQRIEELFWNNQIKLQGGWYKGYDGRSRTKGKIVKELPLPCSDHDMTVSEVSLLLGTSTNIVSHILADLRIDPRHDGSKQMISPEQYRKIEKYRTSIYYSMVARWLLLSPENKILMRKVLEVSANNQLIAKIVRVLWS